MNLFHFFFKSNLYESMSLVKVKVAIDTIIQVWYEVNLSIFDIKMK